MQIDVVKNAKRNIIVGFCNKFILLLCPFVERFVIQNILGEEYLGLDSLFASIISVLSLSEMGFSTAMVYNMYKPVAEGDTDKVNALLNLYKKIYRIIGLVIIVIGLSLIPFLPHFIKDSYPADINLAKLYLIYLGNTALSYFLFAYLSSIVVVHQRDDVNSSISSIIKIGLTISQIAIIVITKNYYLFALLMPVFTIANNILIAWRVHDIFPQYKPRGKISNEDKKPIRKLVAGTFIQRACAVTRNSLDSICVSTFLGLALTAVYNNYFLIISGLNVFVALISSAFAGGIGNHVATRTVEENYNEMKKLDFVYLWIGGWFTTCLMCTYQPFMQIWMGKKMMLPMSAVFLLCGYFYILKLGDIRSLYSSAKGLWWEQRYRALGETICNLVLNILLGKLFGIHGIIIATMISLFICNHIWSVSLTFKLYFSYNRMKDYYFYQAKESALFICLAIITYLVCTRINIDNLFLLFFVRGIISTIIPNSIAYLVYRKSDGMKYIKSAIKNR